MAWQELARWPVLAIGAALLLSPSTTGAAERSGWPQAVDRFAYEKTLAEGCAAILKTAADSTPMARVQGQRLYARARADVDGLIALLKIDLAGDRSPADIPEVRHRLESVPRQRQTLCRHVDAAIGDVSRERPEGSRALALLSEGGSGATRPLLDAATEIWQAYRHAGQADREAIRSAMERTRWRGYADVPGA